MATILLDTSVILDHLNGRLGRTEYLDQLLAQGHLLGVCPVNITEVYAGLRSGEEAETRQFLDSREFFPVTAEIGVKAGLSLRDWRQKGHTLSYFDVTIAAVGAGYGLPLLTDNVRHLPMAEIHLFPLPEPA